MRPGLRLYRHVSLAFSSSSNYSIIQADEIIQLPLSGKSM